MGIEDRIKKLNEKLSLSTEFRKEWYAMMNDREYALMHGISPEDYSNPSTIQILNASEKLYASLTK